MGILLPDPERWAKKSTRARNDLAHTGHSSGHTIEDLYAVVKVTAAVVLLNLLHDMGLTSDRQRTILRDNSDLRLACRLSREHCSDQPAEGA